MSKVTLNEIYLFSAGLIFLKCKALLLINDSLKKKIHTLSYLRYRSDMDEVKSSCSNCTST